MTKDEARDVLLKGKKIKLRTSPAGKYLYLCMRDLVVKDQDKRMCTFGLLDYQDEWEIYEEPVKFTKIVWMSDDESEYCNNPHILQDYLFDKSMSYPYCYKVGEEYKQYKITVEEVKEEENE